MMLLLGVILALYYLPHPQKPFHLNRNYKFETSEELTPRIPKLNISEISKSPIDYRIPDKYNEDQICLLVRDPEWLFAFWEISSKTRSSWTEKLGANFFYDTTQIIRVYNVSEAADSTSYFDISLSEEITRWHIKVDKPNNKYYIAIGRLTSKGEFFSLLISSIVLMPRTCASSLLDENWLPYADIELYNNGLPYSSFTISKERKD